MGRKVALLRAVNVGGRKLPMYALRELCAGIGWAEAETYIQSGNVLFAAEGEREALERSLEEAIAAHFGMEVPVMVRSAAEWARHVGENPFPAAAEAEPNRLMLLVSKGPPAEGAEQAIQAKAAAGEQVRRAGDVLWIHYRAGAGTSKLTPSLIDRAIGSSATARNFRTVIALKERLCLP